MGLAKYAAMSCSLLQFLAASFSSAIRTARYYVNWNLVMPLTKSSDPVSYAELVGPSRPAQNIGLYAVWGFPKLGLSVGVP